MRSFYNDSVLRIRSTDTGTDEYGNPIQTQATATIQRCRVQSMSVEERQMADQNMSEVELRLFAPPGSDIITTDFITWLGKTYKVHGEPQEFRSPTGQANHLLVGLVRIDG